MKTLNDKNTFKSFLEESFPEGIFFRELRLSVQELNYVKTVYPNVKVNKKGEIGCVDNKCWYDVELLNRGKRYTKLHQKKEKLALKKGNRLLKEKLQR